MTSILGICYPLLLYYSILEEIKYKDNVVDEKSFESKSFLKNELIVIGIIVFVAMLSGVFPITMIGIGSDSMYPKIHKGDAIIYKKVYNEDRIKIGDIIVYEDDVQKRTVVHRLVEKKEENNITYYITKGDANNSIDKINITKDEIKGIVVFRIRYVASISVWISELLRKGV